MLTKADHIEYWIKSSKDDWKTVESLFTGKRYLHSSFFAHLTVEKLCKAMWVKNNEDNFPPRIHHLVKLIQQSNIDLNQDQLLFLQSFNDFQIEGRYPDYLFKIDKICTFGFTKDTLKTVSEIIKCLQEKLP